MVDLTEIATKEIVTKDVLREVVWGLGISLILSFVWLYNANYKVVTLILQMVRATKKYGDEDVWDYTFNSKDAAVEYVHVRDFKNRYVYCGWVNTFSETNKIRELVLLDIIVYDFEGIEIYRVPRLYLARSPDDMHIEFPYTRTEP